ncbi:MAG: hypothetical protein ACFNM7_10765 [Prevotella conceptionensis]
MVTRVRRLLKEQFKHLSTIALTNIIATFITYDTWNNYKIVH